MTQSLSKRIIDLAKSERAVIDSKLSQPITQRSLSSIHNLEPAFEVFQDDRIQENLDAKIRSFAHFSCPGGKTYAEMFECEERPSCPEHGPCFNARLPDLTIHFDSMPKPEPICLSRPVCWKCKFYGTTFCTFCNFRGVMTRDDAACLDFESLTRKKRRPRQ